MCRRGLCRRSGLLSNVSTDGNLGTGEGTYCRSAMLRNLQVVSQEREPSSSQAPNADVTPPSTPVPSPASHPATHYQHPSSTPSSPRPNTPAPTSHSLP